VAITPAPADAPMADEPPPPAHAPPPEEDKAKEIAMLNGCAGLKPPRGGCAAFESSQAGCAAFARALKTSSAEVATACMLARSGTSDMCLDGHCRAGDPMCSDLSPNDLVNRCLQRGIDVATPDPAHLGTCQAVAAHCALRGMGQGLELRCQRALSAMKPEHEDLALACLKNGCSLEFCGFEMSFAK
jgi:hypothetical protein